MSITARELRAGAEEALRSGDAQRARALIEGTTPEIIDAPLWLLLARARAATGDTVGATAAINAALALAPSDLSALVAKGDDLVLHGEARTASSYYGAALRHGSNFAKLPEAQQQDLLRARAGADKLAAEFADFTRAHLEQRGFLKRDTPARFAHAFEILTGKKRPYMQAPRHFYYPELPQIQFFPREMFDWIDAVDAAYADVRGELENQLTGPAFDPYIKRGSTRPGGGDQAGMLNNPSGGAKFLIKDGVPQAEAAQCPATMAAMAQAPMPQIKGRTPHALFSKLAAGARIPPHTGVVNVRLICHLPLIVPDGCALRVGNDVREWREGKSWVFDDTIEHEAWNRSALDRYVLIFDVWRPELSEDERLAISTLLDAIDAYGGATAWGDA